MQPQLAVGARRNARIEVARAPSAVRRGQRLERSVHGRSGRTVNRSTCAHRPCLGEPSVDGIADGPAQIPPFGGGNDQCKRGDRKTGGARCLIEYLCHGVSTPEIGQNNGRKLFGFLPISLTQI